MKNSDYTNLLATAWNSIYSVGTEEKMMEVLAKMDDNTLLDLFNILEDDLTYFENNPGAYTYCLLPLPGKTRRTSLIVKSDVHSWLKNCVIEQMDINCQ